MCFTNIENSWVSKCVSKCDQLHIVRCFGGRSWKLSLTLKFLGSFLKSMLHLFYDEMLFINGSSFGSGQCVGSKNTKKKTWNIILFFFIYKHPPPPPYKVCCNQKPNKGRFSLNVLPCLEKNPRPTHGWKQLKTESFVFETQWPL